MSLEETEVSPREFWIGHDEDGEISLFLSKEHAFDSHWIINDSIRCVREITAPQSSDSERLKLAIQALEDAERQLKHYGFEIATKIVSDALEAIGPLDGGSK